MLSSCCSMLVVQKCVGPVTTIRHPCWISYCCLSMWHDACLCPVCLCTVLVAHTWKFCAYLGATWWQTMELSASHGVLINCARSCAKERHRLAVVTVLCYACSWSSSVPFINLSSNCSWIIEWCLRHVLFLHIFCRVILIFISLDCGI